MKGMKLFDKKNSIYWLAFFLAVLAEIYFLLRSRYLYSSGFPLDDTWIHQAYARNLAAHGEWAFVSGTSSSGSTAPLWTVLLTPGYIIQKLYFYWTILLGFSCLFLSSVFVVKAVEKLVSDNRIAVFLAGSLIVLEWHFLWAALSGMETILYILLLSVLFYVLVIKHKHKWIWAGILIGLAIWVRPDGITLLGPVMWLVWFGSKENDKYKFFSILKILLWVLGFFLVYLCFNYIVSGSLWPNTFYAKQAEYAVLINTPLITRLLNLLKLPLVGAGGLLLPGFLFAIWKAIKEKNTIYQAWILWWFGFNLVYALKLPVTYQHGRYQIPSIFIFILIGLLGSFDMSKLLSNFGGLSRIIKEVWILSILSVIVLFVILGGNQYARDVAIIESEMVKTAHWLEANIDAGTLIAVHDIGAIGYFADLNILDLAGLVSPEVIPFIRDEEKLGAYLDEQGVEYLVTFPGWYPELVKHADLIYTTGSTFSPDSGGENMQVFSWKIDP